MNQHYGTFEEVCSPDIRISVQNCSLMEKYERSFGCKTSVNLPLTKDVKYIATLDYDEGFMYLKISFENSGDEEKMFDVCVHIFESDSIDRPVNTEVFRDIILEPKAFVDKNIGLAPYGVISNNQCDIVVRVTQDSLKEKVYNSDNVASSLMPALSTMYQDETFKDVRFIVGHFGHQQSIMAHKNVLATRSKVFHSMFVHDMREKRNGAVFIQDFTAAVFEKFIKYLYTYEIEGIDGMAEELMLIADKYDIQCLKSQCENHLCLKMKVDDAIHFFLMGDKLNFTALKQRALFLIKSNSDITKSPEFSKLFQYSDLQESFVKQIFSDTTAANDGIRGAVLDAIVNKLSS